MNVWPVKPNSKLQKYVNVRNYPPTARVITQDTLRQLSLVYSLMIDSNAPRRISNLFDLP